MISELARTEEPELVRQLVTHSQPWIRCCALEVFIAQDHSRLTAQKAEWIERLAQEDTDERVRSTACHAACRFQPWDVLQGVLTTERSGAVTASALRGLLEAPGGTMVPDRILGEALTGAAPSERYWACLFVLGRKRADFVDALRPLAADRACVSSKWFFADHRWPDWDQKVGDAVADAANAALAVLSPTSAVWRLHSDWQQSILGPDQSEEPRLGEAAEFVVTALAEGSVRRPAAAGRSRDSRSATSKRFRAPRAACAATDGRGRRPPDAAP